MYSTQPSGSWKLWVKLLNNVTLGMKWKECIYKQSIYNYLVAFYPVIWREHLAFEIEIGYCWMSVTIPNRS